MTYILAHLRRKGFVFDSAVRFAALHPKVEGEKYSRVNVDATLQMVRDGAPPYTTPNTTLPLVFRTVVDPVVIEILTAPKKATEIFAEEQHGSWTDDVSTTKTEELVGETEPYTDFSDTPTSDVNYNWAPITAYYYQSYIKIGDREQALSARASIDLVSAKQRAVAEKFAQDSNRFYLRGVGGMPIYGILNSPDLPDSISPSTVPDPAGGGGTVTRWQDKSTLQIYNDILLLFSQLATRSAGYIDSSTPLRLVVSPGLNVRLGTANDYGNSVMKMLNDYFSSLTVVTIPEQSNPGTGEIVMLTAPEVGGQQTASLLFPEKLRSFEPFRRHTTWEEKFMGGTWGSVIKNPFAIAIMEGA